jgi:hypothetical protein
MRYHLRMPIRVEEYIREDASIPYKRWFDSLDAQATAKVATAKLRMELGNIWRSTNPARKPWH